MIQFGMYCAQTGIHREATCASQAIDTWQKWQHAPRSQGTWCLVIDGKVVEVCRFFYLRNHVVEYKETRAVEDEDECDEFEPERI